MNNKIITALCSLLITQSTIVGMEPQRGALLMRANTQTKRAIIYHDYPDRPIFFVFYFDTHSNTRATVSTQPLKHFLKTNDNTVPFILSLQHGSSVFFHNGTYQIQRATLSSAEDPSFKEFDELLLRAARSEN